MRAASFYWNSVDGKVRSEMFSEHGIMFEQMGVSENSVPLHPMVNDNYPY